MMIIEQLSETHERQYATTTDFTSIHSSLPEALLKKRATIVGIVAPFYSGFWARVWFHFLCGTVTVTVRTTSLPDSSVQVTVIV